MLWAATCLCFFSCLVQPQEQSRTEGRDSGWRSTPSGPRVTSSAREPSVQALLKCMARWGNEEGPLFRFRNGRPLTRARSDGARRRHCNGWGQPQQTSLPTA